MNSRVAIAVLVVACSSNRGAPQTDAAGSAIDASSDASAAYLDKVADTPDYWQDDPAYGGFAGAGTNYCAPTSISNSLMWLAGHGFPQLVAATADSKRDQHDLIVTLGSAGYMNTDPNIGTNAAGVCAGLSAYLASKGFANASVSYEGWRTVDAAYNSGVTVPRMASIQQGIHGTGSVWLNIGWYTHDASTDTWTRSGGHWVTVVGYGNDGTRDDPHAVVLHDPAVQTFNDYAELTPLSSGTLAGNNPGLPRSAAGYFELTGSDYYPLQGAIVDGIVVLDVH